MKAKFIVTSGHVARGWIFSISDKSFFRKVGNLVPHTGSCILLDVIAHQIHPKSSVAAEVLSNIIRLGEPNTSHLSTPETLTAPVLKTTHNTLTTTLA